MGWLARATHVEGRESRVAIAVVVASFVVFFGRLWAFVARSVVDVPYWDLWDAYNPFFRGDGLWAAFQYQHGPVRQGLGALLSVISNSLTDWSFSAPAFQVLVILLVASVLALELKIALFGTLTAADALIAPIVFRLSQAQAIVLAPYPACVAMPLVFVLLVCRAMLIRSETTRIAVFALLSFFASYTGFSMFVPPALVAVLALRGAIEWWAGARDRARSTAFAALAVALSAFPAMIGRDPLAFGKIVCPNGTLAATDYLLYVVTMINGSFGIIRRDGWVTFLGALLFMLPIVAITANGIRRGISSARRDESELATARALAPLILIAFSLGFSASTALGRICAPGAALNSRYVALMAPLGLGLYLGLLAWEPHGEGTRRARRVLGAVLVAASVVSAIRISEFDAEVIEQSVTGKQRWIACVRAGGSASECNARAQFQIHPSPEGSRIDEKLELLRTKRLSLFAPRHDAASGE